MPVIGRLLRGLGALPVYRKQDDPSQMGRNEGTFEAAAQALLGGGAITLFPEGKSHSEPSLAELKTGAARIAFRAYRGGAQVRLVPVGLTYEQKHRFRSRVLVEVGQPIDIAPFVPQGDNAEAEGKAVHTATDTIAGALRSLTLNLEKWEDLPLLRVAEEVFALHAGDKPQDPERLRLFAEGAKILRREQPERFEHVRSEVVSLQRRLAIASARPGDLRLFYRPSTVIAFAFRNLMALLLGFPLFLFGVVLFAVPFFIPRWAASNPRVEHDVKGTIKFLVTLVVAPLWLALLTALAWTLAGRALGLVVLLGAPPLAPFTRYFLEQRVSAWRDMRVFFTLGNRMRLKARLLAEGEKLAGELEQLSTELGPRLVTG
jgi:hypothetical protein